MHLRLLDRSRAPKRGNRMASPSVRPAVLLPAFLAASLALAGCTSSSSGSSATTPTASASSTPEVPEELATFYGQSLSWATCPDRKGAQCADLSVPLDYEEPDGETIKLKVLRITAKDKASRVGSLVLNPGGPGASGVEYAGFSPVREDVANVFDIVGFDPRGAGGSEPVECLTDLETDDLLSADGSPDTPEELAKLEQVTAQIAKGCELKSPKISAHVSTESSARDMDILRAALGDKKLNYLGKSYGTYLGAVYADLFPSRVGRMVLDGVLPGGLSLEQITYGQLLGFEDALQRFIEDCPKQDDCPLDKDPKKAYQQIADLLAELDEKPMDGIGDRKLNQALATSGLLYDLYFPPYSWDQLRFGLQAALEDGDGSVLLNEADQMAGRNQDGTYSNNSQEAFAAITCLDRPYSGSIEDVKILGKKWDQVSPIFGQFMASALLYCNSWPWEGKYAAVPAAKGSGPILVVSTKHDPATPYQWGVDVAKQLDNARLVSFEGDGHTAYMSDVGSSCVDKVVDRYLTTGKAPAEDKTCEVS